MVLCPICNREVGDALICKCGADLSLLQQIIARADHLFNQALEAYRAGRLARALEYLEANAMLVPHDFEARIVQAKLLAQLRRWEEAEALIQQVQAYDPVYPGLEVLTQILGEKDNASNL
jgi:tetratricopeptide (TPR) repeat protein